MKEIEAFVASMMESYKATVASRDIDAFMRLYDPAVTIFDAWGVWSYQGAPAWQVPVKAWFASHPTERFSVAFDDVVTVSAPGFATVSAIVTYAVSTADGEPVHAMQNRLTWVLKASGDALKIVHEHTSTPVGFEDQKAILQRETR